MNEIVDKLRKHSIEASKYITRLYKGAEDRFPSMREREREMETARERESYT